MAELLQSMDIMAGESLGGQAIEMLRPQECTMYFQAFRERQKSPLALDLTYAVEHLVSHRLASADIAALKTAFFHVQRMLALPGQSDPTPATLADSGGVW